jgi:polar amino acid transport system permease protein
MQRARTAKMSDRFQRILFYFLMASCSGIAIWLSRDFEWYVVWNAAPFLLKGLGVSWLLAIVSVSIGMVMGTALAFGRMKGPFVVRYAAIAFIEIVRAIPPLTVIFLVFFSVPVLTGRSVSPWAAGFVSLSIIASAYLAEVIRAGLNSVPAVQIETAHATGLTRSQTLFLIVLPQALRNMSPALIAHFVLLFKVTSLIYVIGLIDFYRAIQLVNNRDFAPYALYSTMAIGYFLCCYALSFLVKRLDPKYTLVA